MLSFGQTYFFSCSTNLAESPNSHGTVDIISDVTVFGPAEQSESGGLPRNEMRVDPGVVVVSQLGLGELSVSRDWGAW